MTNKLVRSVLVFAISVYLMNVARADVAEDAYQRGEKLLAQGDFDAAQSAFAAAARADRDNEKYMNKYLVVRKTRAMRHQLDREQNPETWERIARALHSFYLANGIHSQLLAIDTQMHQRLKSARTARILADTQLSVGHVAEAIETLKSLPASQSNIATDALLAVAYTRLGKEKKAERIVEQFDVSDDADPQVLYSVARAYAATGNQSAALTTLTLCFEQIPPSALDNFKNHAKACDEFAALAGTTEFQSVLATESKIKESACSGGSSCAGCPMRGQCSGEDE